MNNSLRSQELFFPIWPTLSRNRLRAIVFSAFILFGQRALAQPADTAQQPVQWEFSARPGTSGTSVLVLHARIRDGWKLYSTTNPDSLGYTRVSIDTSTHLQVTFEETGELQRKKDPLFNGSQTSFFTGDAQFLIHLRHGAVSTQSDLKGIVTFMAAKNESVVGPVDVPFRYGHTPDGAWIAKSTALK